MSIPWFPWLALVVAFRMSDFAYWSHRTRLMLNLLPVPGSLCMCCINVNYGYKQLHKNKLQLHVTLGLVCQLRYD